MPDMMEVGDQTPKCRPCREDRCRDCSGWLCACPGHELSDRALLRLLRDIAESASEN